MLSTLPSTIVDTAGPFKVLVARTAPDSAALRLLAFAEATYPPKRDVLAACHGTPRERQQLRGERDLWWYTTVGTRVPYAVTSAAVTYFLNRGAALRRLAESQAARPATSRTSLVYRASIEWHDRYEIQGRVYASVYVAALRLSWFQYESPISAQFIDRGRTVVLTSAGAVLYVVGDGPQPALVS